MQADATPLVDPAQSSGGQQASQQSSAANAKTAVAFVTPADVSAPGDQNDSTGSAGLPDMDSLLQATIQALQQQLTLQPRHDAPDLAEMDLTDREAVGKSAIAALHQVLLQHLPPSVGSCGPGVHEGSAETHLATPGPAGTAARRAVLPLTPASQARHGVAAAACLTPASVAPQPRSRLATVSLPGSEVNATGTAADTAAATQAVPFRRGGRQAPRARVADMSELMLTLGHAIDVAPNARVPHEVSSAASVILEWASGLLRGPALNRVADQLNADSSGTESGEEDEVCSRTAQGRLQACD